jgi:membrane fusion protein (multidrug efflux system)
VRWVLTIFGILAVVGGLVAIKGTQIGRLIAFGKQSEKDGPPPQAVSSAQASEQAWAGSLTAVGSVTTSKGVALAPDVPGVVTRISFESGATVKQGQVLVELDTSVERAQLASAVARRDLAKSNITRTRALTASGVLSQAQLDADEAAVRTASTDVDGIEAQIAKKTIRAPFAGKLGFRSVNLGQYLQPGTPVTLLETVDAVKVDFSLPQQRLGELSVGQPVRLRLNAQEVVDAGAQMEGKIAAVDPTVDAVTRAVRVQASVATGTEGLRPGMFVEVEVLLPDAKSHVVVPQTAVVHAPYGDSVFLVEEKKPDAPGLRQTPDGKKILNARQQFVKLGQARGDFVAVLDGVKAKEEVVTAGAFKLRNNAPILVDNSRMLEPKLDPHPENR